MGMAQALLVGDGRRSFDTGDKGVIKGHLRPKVI